ncbi:MAG: CarD family transcriptional regulator [Bacillaceae bacterium]|nr:CarD family transcriptional regulator [Bacillaceae bacterium]
MFQIGDKVVYPMHGAGVIEAIEEKEILGERKKYYIMRMPVGEMKVMIPLSKAETSGLRSVIDEEAMKKVIELLRTEDEHITSNWNHRYRMNMNKMRTGDIFDVAYVVRSLTLRDREKGLSTGERKMLDNAKQILISEFVLVKGIDPDQAECLLDELIQ